MTENELLLTHEEAGAAVDAWVDERARTVPLVRAHLETLVFVGAQAQLDKLKKLGLLK